MDGYADLLQTDTESEFVTILPTTGEECAKEIVIPSTENIENEPPPTKKRIMSQKIKTKRREYSQWYVTEIEKQVDDILSSASVTTATEPARIIERRKSARLMSIVRDRENNNNDLVPMAASKSNVVKPKKQYQSGKRGGARQGQNQSAQLRVIQQNPKENASTNVCNRDHLSLSANLNLLSKLVQPRSIEQRQTVNPRVELLNEHKENENLVPSGISLGKIL